MNEEELISEAMRVLGKRKSERKTAACRRNARLGGLAKGKKAKQQLCQTVRK